MTMLQRTVCLAKSLTHKVLSWPASPSAAHFLGEPVFWLLGMRPVQQKIELSQLRRLLVVRLDEIGDVVMTTPFMRELRRMLPEAWITLIVKPGTYNLVELCPYVNEVLTYDWTTGGRFQDMRRYAHAFWLASRHLWMQRYDLAILPRWDVDSYDGAYVCYLSGAHWRVGYSETVNDLKRRHNCGYDELFTELLNDGLGKHEVERGLDVIHFLGGIVHEEKLELWLNQEDQAFADYVTKSHGIDPRNFLIAFGPGAGALKRMWPIHNFLELADWLVKTYNARIVVVGGRGEEVLGQKLKTQHSSEVIDIVGQATLRQSAAVLKRCSLYVGNDAGPMHLAAAAGIPVIEISCHALSGSPLHENSPIRFGPWKVPHSVLQPERTIEPCLDGCSSPRAHCILDIAVEKVQNSIITLLAQEGGSALSEKRHEHAR